MKALKMQSEGQRATRQIAWRVGGEVAEKEGAGSSHDLSNGKGEGEGRRLCWQRGPFDGLTLLGWAQAEGD